MLIKWTVLAKFFLLFILVSSEVLTQENLPSLIKKIQPSVVTVAVYDSSGDQISQGSGFFVSTDLSTLGNAFLGLRREDGRFIGVFWAQPSSEMRH